MAIDQNNPLLNGPRRVESRPAPRLEQLGPAPPETPPETPPEISTVEPVSEAAILAARTPKGGWTRATLAGWNVAWPPPKGWKERLLNGLAQEPANGPGRARAPELSFALPGSGFRVPNPNEPGFDSTKHGLLAPPRVTYRRRAE